MLTPADFIFNEQSSSQYVEFNYTPSLYDSSSNGFYPVSQYLLKIFNQLSTFSQHITIDRLSDYYNFQSYNITFAQNAIKELISATSSRSFIQHESILFPGVRHLSPGIILFERPPCYKIVSTYNDYKDQIGDHTSASEYYLPIPWQVYIAMYNPEDMRLLSVKMFFTSNSLTSLDQTIYSPPLYNFYSNGTLCRPFFSNMEDIEKYPKDLSGVIASAYDWIWNSGFNFDITQNISFFLHCKKYEQFNKYLKTQTKLNINWLQNHHLHTLPTNLHSQWHNPFFKCWEEIPLSEVSSLSWNICTNTDFYYQHINIFTQNLIHQFCNSNHLIIHEQSTDEDYHDENCSENCIYSDEIYQLESYQTFASETILSQNSTLTEALNSSIEYLTNNRINLKPSSYIQCRKMFSNILQNSLLPS